MTKSNKPATTKVVVTLTQELERELNKKAKELFGNRKGSVSTYIEMVLRSNLIPKDVEAKTNVH